MPFCHIKLNIHAVLSYFSHRLIDAIILIRVKNADVYYIDIIKTTVIGRLIFSCGGGTRTRTLIDGFGDRCTTFVRYPQYVRSYKDLAICDTFDISTLPAKFVLKCFMIFGRDLSSSLAISALISSSLSCCGKYFLITFS